MSDTRTAEEKVALGEALAVFDQGARFLEQAYRELWASRERERGDRELSAAERIRDLCHEIRNPMGGVRGLVALLRRALERGEDAERCLRLAGKIAAGLDAMDAVLTEHSESDELRSDAGAIAEETAGLARAEDFANAGDVRLRVEAPEGIELPIPGPRFRRILSNLVRNAVQACGGSGTVTIRIESSLQSVIAWVEDDGRGLPPVPDDELFRRGFSTKGRRRGRGLALVSDLVDGSGGTLRFCRLERGTLARVLLPRRAA